MTIWLTKKLCLSKFSHLDQLVILFVQSIYESLHEYVSYDICEQKEDADPAEEMRCVFDDNSKIIFVISS